MAIEPTLEARDVAETVVPVAEGAEAFVALLAHGGVTRLFLNPGTDTFPVQEALVKLESQGRPVPRTVLCVHENVAMAAAHGSFMVDQQPQAVLVHVDVGTQNVGGLLHNAQRGRAGVLLCAGRTPYTTHGELRGTRTTPVTWYQEQLDQHGIVRNYTKWDYEVRRTENLNQVVARALQIAASEPAGPVYLTVSRELLLERLEEVRALPTARYGPTRPPAASPQDLEEVARWLVQAERPLAVAGMAGADPAAVPALERLAETVGLPVVETRYRVNFPGSHPLHLGYTAGPRLQDADLLLVLDHPVPYIPSQVQPPATARVVQVGVDPIQQTIPIWGFPVDRPLTAQPTGALSTLADLCAEMMTAADRARVEERKARLHAEHESQLRQWEARADARAAERPIAPEWLARCLADATRDTDTIFTDEAVTNALNVFQQLPLDRPGSYFQSVGTALGWALGAALGAKLASPDRTVVALCGDGAFLFGQPIAALWAAEQMKAPFLAVIFNNGCYNATRVPLVTTYPEGASVRGGRFVGIDLTPEIDYALLARSCRAHGETVEDPAELPAALRRGLEAVRGGQAAVLNVVLQRPQ